MKPRRLSLLASLFLLTVAPGARAHEPLWGETPQTFSFGVLHPETRFGWENESRRYRGGARVDNPEGLRMSRQESVVSLQYAPRTALNVRLEIPYVRVARERQVGGGTRRASTGGLGDLVLSAKSRFRADFGPDWKAMHAYTIGLQFPTGEHGGREPDGTPLAPSEQPGTGNWGVMGGYAFAHERLQDTVWASAMVMGDVSGRSRRGGLVTLDAAYGYWTKRATQPQDLGVILAAGPHLEWMGKDRIYGRGDADSGHRLAGLQATLIATRGQYQARLGFLAPVYRHYNGTQLGSGVQFRAGVEALF